ncbi:hypothetical protein QQ045_004142 [Rhodiola kirilowii]
MVVDMPRCSQCFGAMRCFPLPINEGPKTVRSASTPSSASVSTTDQEVRKSDFEFSSKTVSEISNGSCVKISYLTLSPRPANIKEFTSLELKEATKNFSRSLMLGEGGFGGVYKGVLRAADDLSKKIDVAVKQLGRRGLQGHKEWVTEVNVLGVVEHPNLVKLIGYCAEDDERGIHRMLVYEYMSNRSVLDHLSQRSKMPIPWTKRLRIAQDAARGLAYLHEGMDFQIIFRDFKSSNILLDEHWNAKLSDFGLARLGPSDGMGHVSTVVSSFSCIFCRLVVGTIGYAAPEYVQTGHLTCKSDIWSFGVFLYELITGRRPFDRNRPNNEQKLLEWVRRHLSDTKKFQLILDPRFEGHYCLKSAQKLAAVANRCLLKNPNARPKMSQVLEILTNIAEAAEHECSLQQDAPQAIIREKRCVIWRTQRSRSVS